MRIAKIANNAEIAKIVDTDKNAKVENVFFSKLLKFGFFPQKNVFLFRKELEIFIKIAKGDNCAIENVSNIFVS